MNAIAPVQFEFRTVNKDFENNPMIINSKPPLVKPSSNGTKYSQFMNNNRSSNSKMSANAKFR